MTRHGIRVHVFAASLVGWGAGVVAAQPAFSRFDTSVEGWTFYNDGTAFAWSSTIGNPAGSCFCRDAGSGTYWGYAAPAAFRGDQSAAYGGVISFHIRPSAVDTSGNAQPDVTITGGGLTIVVDLANPIAAVWSQFEVPLTPAGGWRVSSLTGVPATEVQLRQALSNVTALRIRGEFRSGSDEAYLDNVGLGADPCYANCDGGTGPILLDILISCAFRTDSTRSTPTPATATPGAARGCATSLTSCAFRTRTTRGAGDVSAGRGEAGAYFGSAPLNPGTSSAPCGV